MEYICNLSTRDLFVSEIHYCTCPKCKKKFPISRKKNKKRQNGHKKDIWCPFCKEVTTMIELY